MKILYMAWTIKTLNNSVYNSANNNSENITIMSLTKLVGNYMRTNSHLS